MRSSWINDEQMRAVLAALMPTNRLVVECCLYSGLRISDVLELRTAKLKKRMCIRERKTGKSRRITWPDRLLHEMQQCAGTVWVFEHRSDPERHRSRCTVYQDLKRAQSIFQRSGVLPKAAQVSPHTARKIAAVRAYHHGGYEEARQLLNHDPAHAGTTLLYALADQMQPEPKKRRKKHGK